MKNYILLLVALLGGLAACQKVQYPRMAPPAFENYHQKSWSALPETTPSAEAPSPNEL
jgi:hypothetical protein